MKIDLASQPFVPEGKNHGIQCVGNRFSGAGVLGSALPLTLQKELKLGESVTFSSQDTTK